MRGIGSRSRPAMRLQNGEATAACTTGCPIRLRYRLSAAGLEEHRPPNLQGRLRPLEGAPPGSCAPPRKDVPEGGQATEPRHEDEAQEEGALRKTP